jgi:iron complex outermembrane receptor protein
MLGVGAEFRHEAFETYADDQIGTGDIYGLGIANASGSRNVAAAYAELQAPLLKNLETQVAVRAEHYNDFGSALTGKLGAKYKVVDGFALRSTYSNGFRAPSLSQISKSTVFAFTSLQDPTKCPVYSSSGTYCVWNVSSVIKANPDLKPEHSNTLTLGFIANPIQGAELVLDGFLIKYRNQVDRLSAQEVVNRESEFPDAVIRNSAGEITQVIRQYRNMASSTVAGIDWESSYSFKFGEATTWKLSFNGTRTLTQKQQDEAGGEEYSNLGYYKVPRLKANAALTIKSGPWNTGVRLNFIGSMLDYDNGGTCNTTATAAGRYDLCKLASYTTTDLSAAYTGFKNWRLSGVVKNFFGRRPPTDVYSSSYYSVGYNASLYDVKGRTFSLTANYEF